MASRPTWGANPTSRLVDPNNIEVPATSSSHHRAVAAKAAAQNLPPPLPTPTGSSASLAASSPSLEHAAPSNKRSQTETSGDEEEEHHSSSEDGIDAVAAKKTRTSKRKRARKTIGKYFLMSVTPYILLSFLSGASSVVDENGMDQGVNVNDIDNNGNAHKKKSNPTADVKHFFKPLPHEANNSKKHSVCKTCVYIFFF